MREFILLIHFVLKSVYGHSLVFISIRMLRNLSLKFFNKLRAILVLSVGILNIICANPKRINEIIASTNSQYRTSVSYASIRPENCRVTHSPAISMDIILDRVNGE